MIQRFLLALTVSFFLSFLASAQAAPLMVGQPVPDFVLKDTSGKSHSLKSYRGQYVVVGFVGVKCPISNAYISRMNGIAEDYKAKDVVFLGINSNAHEPLSAIKAHTAKAKYGFSILKDNRNVVADLFGATVTPEIYVIDGEGVLRYHGRVDSASDIARVERHDLRVALDELLSGKSPSQPELKAFGCQIKRVPGSKAMAMKPAVTKAKAPAANGPVALLKPAEFTKLKTDSQGKVLLVNFWATWCAPCVAEFPEFVKIDKDYRSKGVRMVSISTDEKSDLEGAVIPFLKKQKAEFESFLSDADDPQLLIDVVDKNWSGVLPATFVFDKQGKLIFTKYGIIDREELLKVLDAALK